MKMSDWESGFVEDLANVAAIAGKDTQHTIEALVRVWQPMLRNRMFDLLSAIGAELSGNSAMSADVELRIAGDDVTFAVTSTNDEADAGRSLPRSEPGDADARISLRISDSLKQSLTAAAAADGMSVNTWIARALERAVARAHVAATITATSPSRNQLRGVGRS